MKFSALIPFFLLSTGIVARQSTDPDALIARGEYLIARGERLIARASSSKTKDPKKGKKEPPAVKSGWMGGQCNPDTQICSVIGAKTASPRHGNHIVGTRQCSPTYYCPQDPNFRGCQFAPTNRADPYAQCGLPTNTARR
ncbi:unnamed protein product [Clonostachys byssicola]|uniref:Uncharacterized protein n=1 Tax=Clonostachys byssicola TaxID=160290 RepID=A0A9N9UKS5_9HYPO|nr:unnamed protein product [Clonostachys byssicola]